jgi:hypothetical protein
MPIMPGYTEQDYRKALRELTRIHRRRSRVLGEIEREMNSSGRDSMTNTEKEVADYYFDLRMEKWAILARITGDLPPEKNE